jgi:hypothetical protein
MIRGLAIAAGQQAFGHTFRFGIEQGQYRAWLRQRDAAKRRLLRRIRHRSRTQLLAAARWF